MYAKRFWTSFNIWLSSALDLEVFELTPKETALDLFSDERSLQKVVTFAPQIVEDGVFFLVTEIT
jgi:hypothetical protein